MLIKSRLALFALLALYAAGSHYWPQADAWEIHHVDDWGNVYIDDHGLTAEDCKAMVRKAQVCVNPESN